MNTGIYEDLYEETKKEPFICTNMLRTYKYFKFIDFSDYEQVENEYILLFGLDYRDEMYLLTESEIIKEIIDQYLYYDFDVKRVGEKKYIITRNNI